MEFQFGRKVSRVLLGNSRFVESKSGDWFDLPLSGEPAGFELWNSVLSRVQTGWPPRQGFPICRSWSGSASRIRFAG